MKKIFLFILTAMVVCLFSACSEKNTPNKDEEPTTQGKPCGKNLYWSYDEDTYTLNITGYGDMYDYDTLGPWRKGISDGGYPIPLKIKNINLPEGLTHIGESAFEAEITSIILPSTVTSIGKQAFLSCDDIQYVKSMAVIPPAYGDWCFEHEAGTPCSHIPVYVPSQSLDAYKSAIGWQAHPIQAIP